MPRKGIARFPGVWGKVTGSVVWWIRYRVDGKLKREGTKLPDNLRNAGVRLRGLADAALVKSAPHHRDLKTVKIRPAKLRVDLDGRKADSVNLQEIDARMTANTRTSAKFNGYRPVLSLI